MTEQALFNKLQAHAKAHYSKGWDWVYEALDYRDFQRDMNRASIPLDWHSVLAHYSSIVGVKEARRREIRAESY